VLPVVISEGRVFMIAKIYRNIRSMSKELKELNISAHAAGTAFFLFLSLVPMLVMICTIIPYTPLTQDHFVQMATQIVPKGANTFVAALISEVYEKSAGVLSVAVIAMLWSAGKSVLSLRRGLNVINGDGEKRGYFAMRLIASFYTLVMLLVVLITLIISVFGNRLVEVILNHFPMLQKAAGSVMPFRFLIFWGFLTLFFAAIYAFIPDNKLNYKEQLPGALFTSVMWNLFSFFFSAYVDREGAFGMYGSLSIVVIVMLWMYFCMYILLIGAFLNRFYQNYIS